MRQPQQATRIAGAQQERKIEIQPTKNCIIYICICIYNPLRPLRIWNWNFGFPGHPHNWTWKHLLRIQLTSHRISLGHINSFTFQLANSSFFHRNSSRFFINPSRFHKNSSLFHIFAIQILSLVQWSFFHIYIYIKKSFAFLYKFFAQYEKKLIISGDLFFVCWNVLVHGLQTSRGATPQRELRIWYILIYTLPLLHGRDSIPCRTTYIEYRSPVKIVNHSFRNTN